ncbi:CBS domain-containing protein [Pullulanibacillus sp. KACC 23026]|uniref:CBS domain-containing protein n=1 Tax=Pullulanibacillus sp. KACC 23026 TaxID=3028315 RepID=UPI0023B0CCCE|nr:CBS domain-containing protein [Pullulanibacillus sp. KACC 23026]WEG11121.1 CBS domain-containing protein [Pullulanibacillus sp. KACC 23026]
MEVRDFMIYDVYTANPSTTVKELISLLETNRIGGVPVVDDKGNLVGMVSDGDVVRFLAPKESKVIANYYMSYVAEAENIEDVLRCKMNTPIEKIMVKHNIRSVSPNDDFEKAMRLLSKHHFKKLPVINRAGRVIGVISRGDIIHNLSKTIVEKETELV